jgi:Holliday junction resolvasome RuvABC DNA-binding subunit
MSEPEMCERCRAWGCPSAIACGTCYQVQISKLEARVRELEELKQVVRKFCIVRPTQIQSFGFESAKLMQRMAELTEAGGVGDGG